MAAEYTGKWEKSRKQTPLVGEKLPPRLWPRIRARSQGAFSPRNLPDAGQYESATVISHHIEEALQG